MIGCLGLRGPRASHGGDSAAAGRFGGGDLCEQVFLASSPRRFIERCSKIENMPTKVASMQVFTVTFSFAQTGSVIQKCGDVFVHYDADIVF